MHATCGSPTCSLPAAKCAKVNGGIEITASAFGDSKHILRNS